MKKKKKNQAKCRGTAPAHRPKSEVTRNGIKDARRGARAMAGEGVDGIVGWQVWPSRGFVFIVVDIELSTGGLDSASTVLLYFCV